MKNNRNPGALGKYIRRKREEKQKWMEDVADTVLAVKQRDPAARGTTEILLLYSGVHAMMAYRIANRMHRDGHFFSARAVSQLARHLTGIEIHPGATIGKGLFIDHGMGVVIGETTEIGDNCTIYQGVTLGGTGKDVGKRHPTLGDNVMIGAGAKVLGPVKIGSNSKIAANAVVLREVPENSTAVGIPAKVVRRDGVRVQADLDQIHIPDPVAQEFCRLRAELRELEKRVMALSGDKQTGDNPPGGEQTGNAPQKPGTAATQVSLPAQPAKAAQAAPAPDTDGAGTANNAGDADAALYRRAVAVVVQPRQASVTMLQRRLGIADGMASGLLERMEANGIVTAQEPGGYRCVRWTLAKLQAFLGADMQDQ